MERFYEALYFLVSGHYEYSQWAFEYLTSVFPHAFIVGVIIAPALVAAIYYNLVNNLTGYLGYSGYWYLFMGVAGFIGFLVGIVRATNVIYFDGAQIGPEAWIFAIMNGVYAMLFFFISSMVFKTKKITTYADHIPFNTPW